jgi:hypothetical protein
MPQQFRNPESLKTSGILLMTGSVILPGLLFMMINPVGEVKTAPIYPLSTLELGMLVMGVVLYWKGLRPVAVPVGSSRVRGKIWKIVGFAFLVVAVLAFGLITYLFRGTLIPKLVLVLVAYGGFACIMHGKKLLAPTAEELMSADPRPPVLYLRSFEQDAITSKWSDIKGPLDFFLPRSMRMDTETEEETLSRVMSQIGPFIAIGIPGEKLPELGAARLYVNHDSWREKVSEILSHAKLVVFRIGETNAELTFLRVTSTQGLWWEIQKAKEILRPEQMLFLFAFSNGGEYDGFRRTIEKYFPIPLPKFPRPGLFNKHYKGRINALAYFDGNGTPHIEALRGKKRRTGLAMELERRLKPVASRLGLHWRRPITIRNWALIIGIVTYFLASFLWLSHGVLER